MNSSIAQAHPTLLYTVEFVWWPIAIKAKKRNSICVCAKTRFCRRSGSSAHTLHSSHCNQSINKTLRVPCRIDCVQHCCFCVWFKPTALISQQKKKKISFIHSYWTVDLYVAHVRAYSTNDDDNNDDDDDNKHGEQRERVRKLTFQYVTLEMWVFLTEELHTTTISLVEPVCIRICYCHTVTLYTWMECERVEMNRNNNNKNCCNQDSRKSKNDANLNWKALYEIREIVFLLPGDIFICWQWSHLGNKPKLISEMIGQREIFNTFTNMTKS